MAPPQASFPAAPPFAPRLRRPGPRAFGVRPLPFYKILLTPLLRNGYAPNFIARQVNMFTQEVVG